MNNINKKDSEDEAQMLGIILSSDSIILLNDLILYTTQWPSVDTIIRENSSLNNVVINKSNNLLTGELYYLQDDGAWIK